MSEHIVFKNRWKAAGLALVPITLALAGMYLDERTHFGFSNWRSACRAAGFDAVSLIVFSVDLLPRAALGGLLGIMLVQVLGAVLWRDGGALRAILAAHAGCASGMAAMLLLCTWLSSLPLMLGVEAVLAAASAALLCHGRAARVRVPAGTRPPGFPGSITSQVCA
jgi:hypothetical protein